jgi:hypothetical protein
LLRIASTGALSLQMKSIAFPFIEIQKYLYGSEKILHRRPLGAF